MQKSPVGQWLDPAEREETIEFLLRHGIIKFSNKRDLKLKSGGMTDIYVNLRDARSSPEVIRFVSRLFANPLRRLAPDRFAEVPEAVTCFAGPLSLETNLPYLTIRDKPKAARVSDADVIGAFSRGDNVVLVDDVVTDGESKIVPIRTMQKKGLALSSLVVLVDRQQGWRKKFAAAGISVPVWSGMTLHDIRRYLVESGTMERTDPALESENPIVVALDGFEGWEDVLPLVDQLRTTGCTLKVNDLIFKYGLDFLPNLAVYGRVMVDIKSHDISNTMKNIVGRLRPYNPWAVTVHGSAGKEGVAAAVAAVEGTDTKVLVVTVLTSIDKETCEEIYNRLPLEQVLALAAIGKAAGAHGFVCSPEEVGELKKIYGDSMEYVVPGVRSEGADAGDQKRIDTPAATVTRGATRLVMGRQILKSADPVSEMMRVLRVELNKVV